jgi:hypothetical protein
MSHSEHATRNVDVWIETGKSAEVEEQETKEQKREWIGAAPKQLCDV